MSHPTLHCPIGERSLPCRCCFETWDFEDLVGFPFFKCDEIRLSWVLTVKTTVILLKNIFEFMFNRARSTLYRLRWRRARGKGFNIIFSNLSQCVLRGLVVTLCSGLLKVLSWICSICEYLGLPSPPAMFVIEHALWLLWDWIHMFARAAMVCVLVVKSDSILG